VLVLAAVCIALSIAAVFFLLRPAHTVRLTADGFVPAKLTIHAGETVRFVTDLDRPFWPASSVHPSHTIYPEFDPKMRIAATSSWSFVFDKVGSWRYHDHLSPNFEGVIEVLPRQKGKGTAAMPEDCTRLLNTGKIKCMDEELERILSEEGVKAAFDYFVELYHADPEVANVCHGWAHRLGEVDYENYKAGKEIELRPEATFCSYGYFHGFIGAMVHDTQSIDGALAFCDAAIRKVGDSLKGLKNNCVHGIGHGVTGIIEEEPESWGNFSGMTKKGMALCDTLYKDPEESQICADGVFHELHLNIFNNAYGLSLEEYKKSGDLFFYCTSVADLPHNDSCYYDFVTLWPIFFGEDKVAAARYVAERIPQLPDIAERVLNTFARSFIEQDIAHGDYAQSVAACRAMPQLLFSDCMRGLTTGFAEHAEPGKADVAGFAFCRSDLLTGDERTLCFTHMADQLWWQYDAARFAQACAALAPLERQGSCLTRAEQAE
jgi:hypothetical protein